MSDLRPGAIRLLIAPALLLAPLAGADGDRPPSIMAPMHRQYTVSRAPFKIIGKEMGDPSPDWVKVRDAGGSFKVLAEALAKKTPRRGDPGSWRQSVGRHLADASALEDAARRRDLSALRVAHKRIAASCQACHDAHRFRRGD